MRAKKKFEWCLKQGENGRKHRGLKKIKPDFKEAEKQIKKALSDLDTMQYLYQGNRTDWVASAAFYTMYHSLLAILYKIGYESRNQECTITAVEYFIKIKVLNMDENYIKMIRSLQETEEDAKKVREDMQYGSKTQLENDKCKVLMKNAKKFVEEIRSVLEEI
jgi:uncharacterized protein (UPF0332 family)